MGRAATRTTTAKARARMVESRRSLETIAGKLAREITAGDVVVRRHPAVCPERNSTAATLNHLASETMKTKALNNLKPQSRPIRKAGIQCHMRALRIVALHTEDRLVAGGPENLPGKATPPGGSRRKIGFHEPGAKAILLEPRRVKSSAFAILPELRRRPEAKFLSVKRGEK